MKRITQTDVIKSNDVNGSIESENKLEYNVARDISEFTANQIPPLSVVQQLVAENIPVDTSTKGEFPSTDTGQLVINIPHGLPSTPTWFSVQGLNIVSTGVMNKCDLTVDGTNIIITPDFMNGDNAVLKFLWKAEL